MSKLFSIMRRPRYTMAPPMPVLLTSIAQVLLLSETLVSNELLQYRLIAGNSVVHLVFGEATLPMQKDVLQAHRDASSDTSYLPVAGLMKLREVSLILESVKSMS